jgi:thymidylate synthase
MSRTSEQEYLDILHYVLTEGEDRTDRTGVGTRSVFATTLRFDLTEGFPLLTTKKMPFKSIVSELLWFLEGSSDERRLAEILHETREASKTTIWTANAEADYWKPKAEFDGDLGPVYGVQWRKWKKFSLSKQQGNESGDPRYVVSYIDQLARVINTLNTNPTDRRLIVSAWNVADLDAVALPPCHYSMQFYRRSSGCLDLLMQQRSVDTFLGLPFNIASYALLLMMVAQVTGNKPGILTMSLGDTHIYANHFDQVREQLEREPLPLPTVTLNPNVTDIDSFTMKDFTLNDYHSRPAIKAPMAV